MAMTDVTQTVDLTSDEFDALAAAAGLTIPEDMRAQVLIGANHLRRMAARLHGCDMPADPATAPE
jgi:Protein of unknown function (DUF4089)